MSLPTLIEHFDNDLQLPRNPARIRDYTLENGFGCADAFEQSLQTSPNCSLKGENLFRQAPSPVGLPLNAITTRVNRPWTAGTSPAVTL